MKFAVGDIVSYKAHKRHGDICSSYVERYGYGPYCVRRYDGKFYVLETLSGQMVQIGPDRPWFHSEENLQLEVFLTAARKAVTYEKNY